MGGPFVKLIGVGAFNVAKRAARHFPRRHHIWRARCISSASLLTLARAGARVWARRGGGAFSLHVRIFSGRAFLLNPSLSELWL